MYTRIRQPKTKALRSYYDTIFLAKIGLRTYHEYGLADCNDEDALAPGNVQPRNAEVIEVLPLQLGVPDLPPDGLSEVHRAEVLQNLGDEGPQGAQHRPPGVEDFKTGRRRGQVKQTEKHVLDNV
jgi:hypothetical protein